MTQRTGPLRAGARFAKLALASVICAVAPYSSAAATAVSVAPAVQGPAVPVDEPAAVPQATQSSAPATGDGPSPPPQTLRDSPAPPAQEQARYQAELSFDFLAFENFFQAPDGVPSTNVYGLRAIGRLGYQAAADGSLLLFGEVGRTWYDELENSTLVRGGVEYDDNRHALFAAIGLETERPILDVGDGLGTADAVTVQGEYGYLVTRDWELKGSLVLQDQSFEAFPTRDNYILGVGPAVRYRGFGSVFSPEAGVLFGGRNAVDDDEDHSQTDLYVQVRSAPAPPVYLSVRYRHRTREYDTLEADSRNFLREDTRRQLAAVAVIELVDRLDLNLYYAFQAAESTLASRTFDNQLLFAGLAYTFGRR